MDEFYLEEASVIRNMQIFNNIQEYQTKFAEVSQNFNKEI